MKTSKLSVQIAQFDINWENQNPALPLSQATAYNHHNVFTFTLPLSEGRAGGPGNPLSER
jgi:hypothetical protein